MFTMGKVSIDVKNQVLCNAWNQNFSSKICLMEHEKRFFLNFDISLNNGKIIIILIILFIIRASIISYDQFHSSNMIE